MTGLSSVLKNFLHKNDQPSTKQSSAKSAPTTAVSSTSTPSSRLADPPGVAQPEQAHLSNKSQANQQSMNASQQLGGQVSKQQEQAESIVRRENEAKAKRDATVFDGLPDGITLGRKMGDGAFSNVFEASLRPSPAQMAVDPTLGKQLKVAVKCVRKYELNSSQVSPTLSLLLPLSQNPRIVSRPGKAKFLERSEGLN